MNNFERHLTNMTQSGVSPSYKIEFLDGESAKMAYKVPFQVFHPTVACQATTSHCTGPIDFGKVDLPKITFHASPYPLVT